MKKTGGNRARGLQGSTGTAIQNQGVQGLQKTGLVWEGSREKAKLQVSLEDWKRSGWARQSTYSRKAYSKFKWGLQTDPGSKGEPW